MLAKRADARGAPDGEPSPSDEHSPDLVGEELGDDARIWRVYDRVAREEDRERVANWTRGLDNLALFAGLFSAVTTAFIIESQQDTEPDYARLTFLVLNSSSAGVPFREEPFAIDPSVRLTNSLWISSLMLSLTAALIAIMGKDWIGMYVSRPVCNPRQWAEIRTYRLGCVDRWYMSGVISSAPVLLHMSLVLFAAGLVIFVAPDPLSQRVALALSLAASALYFITVLSAIIFPSSPFKSPATQAFRATVFATLESLRDWVVYPAKRQPIAMLQQATLIIGAVLAHPLPVTIVPLGHSERRRLRRTDTANFGDILVRPGFENRLSLTDKALHVGRATWALSKRFARIILAQWRAAVDGYRYRRRRPRARPWYSSVGERVHHIDLSDCWASVDINPSPELLAQSLSHLNVMTQATDVFQSILVALGDIAIGRQVAPLLSFDLKSRLATEIRHKWHKAHLVALSRYTLAEKHLDHGALLPPAAMENVVWWDREPYVKSEIVVFAYAELSSVNYYLWGMINRHCPDVTLQPRALQYLLPLLPNDRDLNTILSLAQHYWHHMKDDERSNLELELQQRLGPALKADFRAYVASHFRGRSGLVELLVFLMIHGPVDIGHTTCLIAMAIEAESGARQHPGLVYAFGHIVIASHVWAAVSSVPNSLPCFEPALPLLQHRHYRWDKGFTTPLVSEDHPSFTVSLARTVLRLLTPSHRPFNFVHGVPEDTGPGPYLSTLELCARILHTQLCSARDEFLNTNEKHEIIEYMLEQMVFIKLSALWDERVVVPPTSTTEHGIINILTTTTRHVAALLSQGTTFDIGARLLGFLSFAETKSSQGSSLSWDLGSYLRDASTCLSEQGEETELSMRRLLRSLRALRPLCASHDDLCAAWDRIGLVADNEYADRFWDAEGFELGAPPELGTTADGHAATESRMHWKDTPDDGLALYYLDEAMR